MNCCLCIGVATRNKIVSLGLLVVLFSSARAEVDSCYFVDTVLDIPNDGSGFVYQTTVFKDESWDHLAAFAYNADEGKGGILRFSPELDEFEWRFLDGPRITSDYVVADVNGDGFMDLTGGHYIFFQDSEGNFSTKYIHHGYTDLQFDWDNNGMSDSRWYHLHSREIAFNEFDSDLDTLIHRSIPFELENPGNQYIMCLAPDFGGHSVVVVGETEERQFFPFLGKVHFYSLESGLLLHTLDVPEEVLQDRKDLTYTADWDGNGKQDILIDIGLFEQYVIINNDVLEKVEWKPITASFDISVINDIETTIHSDASPWNVSVHTPYRGFLAQVDERYHFEHTRACGLASVGRSACFLSEDGSVVLTEKEDKIGPRGYLLQRISKTYSHTYDGHIATHDRTIAKGDTIEVFGSPIVMNAFDVDEVVLKSRISGIFQSPFIEINSELNSRKLVCVVDLVAGDEIEFVIPSKWIGENIAINGYRTLFQGASFPKSSQAADFELLDAIDVFKNMSRLPIAQLDDDNFPDFAIVGAAARCVSNRISTGEIFREQGIVPSGSQFVIFDFDADGDLDITVYNNGRLSIIYDNVSEFLADRPMCEVRDFMHETSNNYDLDADGVFDAYLLTDAHMSYSTAYEDCTKILQSYAPPFRNRRLSSFEGGAHNQDLQDLDANGIVDFVFQGSNNGQNGLEVMTLGTFKPMKTKFVPYQLETGYRYRNDRLWYDIDSDGVVDVFVSENKEKNTAVFLMGDADWNFELVEFNVGKKFEPVQAVDINGDRVLDLLVLSGDSLRVAYGGVPFDVSNFEVLSFSGIDDFSFLSTLEKRELEAIDFDLDGDILTPHKKQQNLV